MITVAAWVAWTVGLVVAAALVWLAVFATIVAGVRVGIAFALDGADIREHLVRCIMQAVARLRDGAPADGSPITRLRPERPFKPFSTRDRG